MVLGTISWPPDWLETAGSNSSSNQRELNNNNNGLILTMLKLQRSLDGSSTIHQSHQTATTASAPFLEINFNESKLFDTISIQSNARFIEIYIHKGKDFEYIETCRGVAANENPNVFMVTTDKRHQCSLLKFKFASLKGVPDQLHVDAIAIRFINSPLPPSVSPASSSAPVAPASMSQGLDANSLLVFVDVVKASLLSDFSRLLDSKLLPVIAKLDQLNCRVDDLSKKVNEGFTQQKIESLNSNSDCAEANEHEQIGLENQNNPK